MIRKHCNIEQIDGNISVTSDKFDEQLGTIFQSFLDANDIIEENNLEEEVKIEEKEKVLQACKSLKSKYEAFHVLICSP